MNKLLLLFIVFLAVRASAQTCPPNIGFENGNFDGWQCYAGTVDQQGNYTLPPTGPVPGRHTMYAKASGNNGNDEYGGFPRLCPNGSNYSIQLGDADVPSIAERISYTFTVPTGQTDYTIFYDYAIVLQDPAPGGTPHTTEQKPLFSAEIYDVESNQYITCASFSYNAGSSLPGFSQSQVNNSKGIVYYKGWTPASINLRGYGGRTVRLEFTARCCLPGGHFGYAYLDVNEPCGNAITGNITCANENQTTLYAPSGFYQYHWYTSDFKTLLGTDYTLTLNPAPVNNTTYALEIIPFAGLGCPDTLYTTIDAISAQFNFSMPDSIGICPEQGSVDLTASKYEKGNSGNLTYSYYTDPEAQNYLPDPTAITQSGTYYVKAVNPYGCSGITAVKISISDPQLNITKPTAVTYPESIDISKTFTPDTALTYSYYSDPLATVPLTNYASLHYSGIYYIKAQSKLGCYTIKAVVVTVHPPPPPTITGPNTFTPNGDGINDFFNVTVTGYGQFKTLKIYNRYGAQVFYSADINTGWDGNFKGQKVPEGTYYWIVSAVNTYFRSAINESGSITVVR